MIPTNGKARRPRRTFSEEFKKEAVNLVFREGYSFRSAAEAADVNENSLRLWFKKYVDQEKPLHSNVTNQELRAELKRLRVQLDELQMERDILKKAMIYFVSESNVG